MLMQFELEQPAFKKNTRRTKWLTFFIFLGGSTFLLITILGKDKLNVVNWKDRFIAVGAIIWLVYTVIAGLSLVKYWSNTEDNLAFLAVEKTFSRLIGVPIIVLVGVWVLMSVFGWLSSIPSWAAVIIALLILLLIRQ